MLNYFPNSYFKYVNANYLYVPLILWFIFAIKISSFGQGETNIWYFGNHAGLDFNTQPPSVLTNSAMNTIMTCGSISDAQGNILFYTNGATVWNKNHQVMTNGSGLNGDSANPNSGLIVPKPGSTTNYYIITQNNGDLYYSEVNTSLSSGLGAVLTPKNINIINGTDGTVTVAKHANCGNWWLITRMLNSNSFRSFEISSSGFTGSAVTSMTGSICVRLNVDMLKTSPSQSILGGAITTATSFPDTGIYEIYNFNRSTGQVSHIATLPGIIGPFSIEFSPDGSKFYGTSGYQYDEQLFQYDLSTLVDSIIINSRVSIDSQLYYGQLDIQLATDGKIYVIPNEFSDSIGVIHSPNSAGMACNYSKFEIDLGTSPGLYFPRMVSTRPNFIQINNTCEGDSAKINLINPSEFIAFNWNFGDTLSGSFNNSIQPNPKHKFSGPGYYRIQFIGLNGCFQLDTLIDSIYIHPIPKVNLGIDSSICAGDTIILNAWDSVSTYLWQDSITTDSVYFAYQDTLYWVEASNGCGSVIDSIEISFRNFDNTDLGSDTSICPGDTLLLDATTPYAQYYLWQDNSTDSIYHALSTGSYWVEISNYCDTFSDTIDVFVVNPPNISLGPDTSRCAFDSISLNGHLPGVNYLWYNRDTTQFISTADTGILWVTVSNSRCFASDSIHVGIYDSLRVDLGNDTSLCQGNPISLSAWQALPQVIQYQWSNASTDSSIMVNQSGHYIVNVSDYCMSISDSIQVTFIAPPLVNLGFDTTICFGEDLELDAGNPGSIYLWYDSSMNRNNTVNAAGKYWVRVENLCGTSADTILVNIRHAPNIFLGNDTTLCIDKTMTLDAYADDASYLWQDGSTGRFYTVTREGEYWVNVKNVCDQDDDSIRAFYIEKPIINLGRDTSICLDQRLILDVTTVQASYTWSDGSEDSVRVIRESGEYIVDVVNICGADQAEINVEVEDCNCRLFIPKSFTPNGDGINDIFEVQTVCNIVDFNIMLLNRWGEIIFESDEVDFKWDGNYSNKELMQENYVYSIQLSYINGQIKEEKTLTGRVLLMR